MILKAFLAFLMRAATTALSPVLEKNAIKTLALSSPLVVSMSRVVVLAFAGVMLREFWRGGIDGWPDAALGIATVLALPLMNTLERANPDEVLAVTRMLLARFGTSAPSKFDDHRAD